MVNYQRYFRVSLVLSILCFIIFQGLIISVNIDYGQVSRITADNSELLVSDDQFQFLPYSNATSTMTGETFFMLGYSPQGNNSNRLELLTSYLSEDQTEITQTTLVYDLPSLDTSLQYGGLANFGQSLWTIGTLKTIVDNSTLQMDSVMIEFDMTGNQLSRISMPIREFNYAFPSEIDQFQRIILSVDRSELKFLEITPSETILTTYSFNLPSFESEEIRDLPENNQAFGDNSLIWMRYPADPFLLQESESIEQISESPPHFNAISISNPDGFVRTLKLESIRSNNAQVPLTTVTTESIPQPVFDRDDQYLLVHHDLVILPVFISDFSSNTTQAFYGIDLYNPSSAFFTPINGIFLSLTLISGIIAIYSRYKHQSSK